MKNFVYQIRLSESAANEDEWNEGREAILSLGHFMQEEMEKHTRDRQGVLSGGEQTRVTHLTLPLLMICKGFT